MNDELWFEGTFDLDKQQIVSATEQNVAETFLKLLLFIQSHHPEKFPAKTNLHFTHELDFPRTWGLGSSSTLIYNMANWAGLDPFILAEYIFGGSGYDIACAGASGPIKYKRLSPAPRYKTIDFNPSFAEQLYFVYLGQKQNSREGIRSYRERCPAEKKPHAIAEVEELNENILAANSLGDFEESIREHESIIANIIEMPKVKDLYFSDLAGEAKSLGAWGGDFALLTFQGGLSELKKYCQPKGMDVVIPFKEMIL